MTPIVLAQILRDLAASRREGVLHLQRDDAATRIFLKDGAIVACHSGAGSGDEVRALMAEEVPSMLRSAFLASSGSFHFEERDVTAAAAVRSPVTDAIVQAVRAIEDPSFVYAGLGNLRAIVHRAESPLPPLEGTFDLSVETLLERVNGSASIEAIAEASPDEDDALRLIYALLLSGVLEVEPAPVVAGVAEPSGDTQPPSGVLPAAPDAPVETLGRYEVVRPLGRGAMGAVYLAKDPTIDRTVAIKLIQTAGQLSPGQLEKYRGRFYQEAKAAGKLLHPGIVTVFDVGHTTEDTPFIVMENVEGQTLLEMLQANELGPDEARKLALQILEPIAFAHSKGVVHRDIKPSNILVTRDGAVKVMDFGVAHVVGSEITGADDILGSPNYMAPEQLSKEKVDARTDLFAFGVVLYRMLVGKLPFTGDSFAIIAKAVLFDDPPPPSTLDPSIPADLSDVVMRCLAKDPAARFQSASDVQAALGGAPNGAFQPGPAAGKLTPHRPVRWFRTLLAAVAILGIGLAGLSLWRWYPRSGLGDEPAAAEAPSDETLYDEAVLALERGDLAASKAAIDTLVRRNPLFGGGRELLAQVNEALRDAAADEASSSPNPLGAGAAGRLPGVPLHRSDEAALLYQATVAFERGHLAASKQQLEMLLEANPSLDGASELLRDVNDAIWLESLPMSVQATHNHRLGSCRGTLSFESWGIGYASDDHMWQWSFEELRVMEWDGSVGLALETHETETLSLGKPKNYKFELETPLRERDWSRYRRLTQP